jgi:hypothetical protein
MKRVSLTLSLCLLTLLAAPGFAQFPDLNRVLDKVGKKVPLLDKVLKKQPITTSLEDAQWEDAEKDDFEPKKFSKLTALERTETGGFILKEGAYSMQTQSYCLKAGTHGPGGGDGYLFAPTAGPAQDAIISILRGSVAKPEIPQQDIQVLLWAIIARAKFEDLDSNLKLTASQLLTTKQLASLNRSVTDMVSLSTLDRAGVKVPETLRKVLESEARLRQMLATPGTSFAEMERVAVLSGAAPLGEGSRDVPSGRWSVHPDGYYVRYLPSGYSSTRVEIWVPQGSPSVGKEYDPATHIAVPGNTARQRLIQSGRAQK